MSFNEFVKRRSLKADDTRRTRAAELTLRQSIYPICLVTILFFLWGFSYGLLDTLNKHFQVVLGINRSRSAGLQAAYFGYEYGWGRGALIRPHSFVHKLTCWAALILWPPLVMRHGFFGITATVLYSYGACVCMPLVLYWPFRHSRTIALADSVLASSLLAMALARSRRLQTPTSQVRI